MMKSRIKYLIILSVLLGTGVFLYHQVYETDLISRTNQPPINKPKVNPAAMTRAKHEGAFIAILVVPKAYQPLLDKFSRSKLAREIQIIPANMTWNEGEPVVVPRQQTDNWADGNIIQKNKGLPSAGRQLVRENPKVEALWAAAFMKLLAETAKRTHSNKAH